ncbi:putative ATPase/DNA-binding CsgD family transcriptional regulator [Kibdelosporangium banguiense]|uniref:ATPase/DNA-binding CsgD family transcriptional regulator n=1 Tax=Kibdelosporangium banguiense TaxID=1365924 RepID=A0ABS4TGE9_9PSEU|nr:LuxR C-terminal-related transcriptional regulator [Kibdelosporangium banguiense]MBP2323503.1 putative ATPase/DNA-binding CsgD family transcriptional regulator [Kibdelosporangium banguiense]
MPARTLGNLPVEQTSFVGRRRELSEARRQLSTSRLVTCTGPGGVGKTRLALRIGAQCQRAFPDGVWLVELAGLNEGELIADAVADTFGLSDHRADPTGRLAEYLQDKHLLLVLDNCEHLVDACAVLLTKLLTAAPRLHILATSRQLLRMEGEQLLPLAPLTVFPSDGAGGAGERFASEAVTLFADRAAAAAPSFRLTGENLAEVHAICRRLDGIPLAIELAAVRCRGLGPTEILAHLDDAFALLTSERRGGDPRHRTLETAMAGSHRLCSPTEQRMWARLSMFADDFGLDAVEAVCSGDGIDRSEVFDLVVGLADKSIVIRVDGSYGRQARFRQLVTVRQYGARELASSGEELAVRERHLGYYRALVDRGENAYFHACEIAWFTELRREHRNLRSVLEFCLADPARAPVALDIVARLQFYWFACGLLREGGLWSRRALAAAPQPSAVRAHALVACAYLLEFCGEYDAVASMLDEACVLAGQFGDPATIAQADWCRALRAIYLGDAPSALTLLNRAMVGFRAASDMAGVFRTLIMHGIAAFTVAPDEGRVSAEQARALVELAGAGWSKCIVLRLLGRYRLADGALQETAALFEEALSLAWQTYDLRAIGRCVEVLGWCASGDGRHERAALLWGAADTLRRFVGAEPSYPHISKLFVQYERITRDALTEHGFEAALARGKAMSPAEVVEFTLEKAAPSHEKATAAQLTRRETEIAELVGQGLTNKEIAARLVIAQRTAEGHVERILDKLGFRSRVQIAAWIKGGADDA